MLIKGQARAYKFYFDMDSWSSRMHKCSKKLQVIIKKMWILDDYSQISKYFAAVVEKYEAAGKVMKIQGMIKQQWLNTFNLVSH